MLEWPDLTLPPINLYNSPKQVWNETMNQTEYDAIELAAHKLLNQRTWVGTSWHWQSPAVKSSHDILRKLIEEYKKENDL